MTTADESLKTLYGELMAARRRSLHAAPVIPVEEVHALATGAPVHGDRAELLEAVLAHPQSAREFNFFLELPAEPRVAVRPWYRSPGTLALAAGVVLAAGFGLRAIVPPAGDDVMRNDTAAVELLPPGTGDRTDDSLTFAWRAVADAERYTLDVSQDDGTSVVSRTLTDTVARAVVPAGTLRWWVTAHRVDGTTLRSDVRSLQVPPR